MWQDNGDETDRGEVVVRVYNKEKLLNALNDGITKGTIEIGDNFEWNRYNSCIAENGSEKKLNAGNYFANTFAYSEGNRFDFIVLEYTVGNGSPAVYTNADILSAANQNGVYAYNGTVENDKYLFAVAATIDNSGDVMLVNTRKGEVSISANKTWKDENNKTGNRYAKIQFQLYRGDKKFTNINEEQGIVIKKQSEDAKFEVELDKETGIITVQTPENSTEKDTSSAWEFSIEGLPLYSEYGELLYYNMEEIPKEVKERQTVYYIERKVSAEVDENDPESNKKQKFNFGFENTITGTVRHVAYKYWKDDAVGKDNRPDIYMNLKRYIKSKPNSTREEYLDYKAQVWTVGTADGDGTESGYNVKVEIDDLPRFSPEGEEYAYEFEEKMNNNGKTVLGTYKMQSETRKYHPEDLNSDTYEVFTNTITDYMTVDGTKIWTGFQGYQIGSAAEYPNPDLLLYRIVGEAPANWSTMKIADIENSQNSRGNKPEYITFTTLINNKSGYHFPAAGAAIVSGQIEDNNGVKMLPKFDKDGKRYTYLIKKRIVEKMLEKYEVSRDVLEADVEKILNQMREIGALDE